MDFLYKTSKKQVPVYFIYSLVESGHRIQKAMCHEVSVVGLRAFVSPWLVWLDFQGELEQSFISWDTFPRLCNVTFKTKQTCCSTTSVLFLLYPNQVIFIQTWFIQ